MSQTEWNHGYWAILGLGINAIMGWCSDWESVIKEEPIDTVRFIPITREEVEDFEDGWGENPDHPTYQKVMARPREKAVQTYMLVRE